MRCHDCRLSCPRTVRCPPRPVVRCTGWTRTAILCRLVGQGIGTLRLAGIQGLASVHPVQSMFAWNGSGANPRYAGQTHQSQKPHDKVPTCAGSEPMYFSPIPELHAPIKVLLEPEMIQDAEFRTCTARFLQGDSCSDSLRPCVKLMDPPTSCECYLSVGLLPGFVG